MSQQSRVKADIISKYFSAWANIVGRNAEKLVYVDLFAGRGRYDDGRPSTPLLVLERAIADARLRQILVFLFNDSDPKTAEKLRQEISQLPNIAQLQNPPKVYASQVGPEIAALFQKVRMAPTLAFIDPFGYKGLSRDLIGALIKDWASECAFFFNYNRISMGLKNWKVEKHMRAIFGAEWLENLQLAVGGLKRSAKEWMILKALKSGLRELGAQHVMTFRFRWQNGRTSHYLIFVTKHELGCNVMRDVMAGMSSYRDADGVPSFDYDPRLEEQPDLGLREGGRLGKLTEKILKYGAGKTMTVKALFDGHSHCRPYVKANYKDALIRLEEAGVVITNPPSDKRRKGTLADHVTITFPRLSGNGAKIEASRSTPARPAAVRQSSASVHPTA